MEQNGEVIEAGRELGGDCGRPDGKNEDLGQDCDCGNGKEGIMQEMFQRWHLQQLATDQMLGEKKEGIQGASGFELATREMIGNHAWRKVMGCTSMAVQMSAPIIHAVAIFEDVFH